MHSAITVVCTPARDVATTQITVLSGVERRRHLSDERKLALVEAAIVPGALVATIAREADVSPSSTYRWRRNG